MSAPKQKIVTAAAGAAPTTVTEQAATVTINGRQFAAAQGETVLDVARREGIDIPALCSLEGSTAWGGCRLCLVEVAGVDKLQAACTTWVADGLSVQTETPRVRARRESYLRMYLSDHNAYCEAPCTHACPTHVDIPGYLAALAAGDAAGAAALLRAGVPSRRRGRAHRHLCAAPRRRRSLQDRTRAWSLKRQASGGGGCRAGGIVGGLVSRRTGAPGHSVRF
jgi:formate dehydrogenase major subunit